MVPIVWYLVFGLYFWCLISPCKGWVCSYAEHNNKNSFSHSFILSFTHVHYTHTKYLLTGRILIKLHLLLLRHFCLFIFVQVIHIFVKV
uniref:Uncharacterized protein n=1 Tax=Sphaeramia orbicularis TaxID=375764 RepID=A0A673ATL8_9TELE